MDNKIRKIGITSLLVVIATALGGCLPEMGDTLADGEPIEPQPPSDNRSPIISGTPGTSVLMGDAYGFTPTASDPDDDVLTFSAQNVPPWLQFSTESGALTGTPSLGNVGTYPNIVLSVSDGNLSSSLPGFSVSVVQNADGSITVNWSAPTENEDGTALLDLTAYNLYYGTSPGSYADRVRIDNPGINTFVIENLVPATYYIVATSVNSLGVESQFSNETVKQVL